MMRSQSFILYLIKDFPLKTFVYLNCHVGESYARCQRISEPRMGVNWVLINGWGILKDTSCILVIQDWPKVPGLEWGGGGGNLWQPWHMWGNEMWQPKTASLWICSSLGEVVGCPPPQVVQPYEEWKVPTQNWSMLSFSSLQRSMGEPLPEVQGKPVFSVAGKAGFISNLGGPTLHLRGGIWRLALLNTKMLSSTFPRFQNLAAELRLCVA